MLLGGWLAQRSASAEFFLGETAGGWYYSLFPPAPTLPQQLTGIVIVLAVLTILASLSWKFGDSSLNSSCGESSIITYTDPDSGALANEAND